MKSKAKSIFHVLTSVSAVVAAVSSSALFAIVPPKVAAGVTAASAVISAILHFWKEADPTVDQADAATPAK